MYVPSARELVEIVGRSEKFLVVWVDEERQSVDVISLIGKAHLTDVPFAAIRPYREDVPLETN